MCLPSITYSQDNMPIRNVELVDDGVIVTYRFPQIRQQECPSFPQSSYWKIPGFPLNDVEGEPAVPFHWDTFAVPEGATASVEVIDSAFVDVEGSVVPNPKRTFESISDNNCLSNYSFSGDIFPCNIIEASNIRQFRNSKVLRVRTSPVQYNKSEHIVRLYKKIKYKVMFTGTLSKTKKEDDKNTKRLGLHYKIFQNSILNPTSSSSIANGISERNTTNYLIDNPTYLIITTDSLLDPILSFAEWKKMKGFNVIIESRNQWTNTDSVKSIIERHYMLNDLEYVLFVGDDYFVPTYHKSTMNNYIHNAPFLSDFDYRCISNDDLPDVFLGRIPVSTPTDVINVLNKIYNYESYPPSDSSFYNSGLHISQFIDEPSIVRENGHVLLDENGDTIIIQDGYEDKRNILTSEEIRNYMILQGKSIYRVYTATENSTPLCYNRGIYSNGDSLPNELRYGNYYWNGTNSEIINKINEGQLYILYRGHGNQLGWCATNFISPCIYSLQNINKTPVVFSIACHTSYYTNRYSWFGQNFINKSNGGCVAFLGATTASWAGYNDMLAEGIFDAIWPEPGLHIRFKHDEDTTTYHHEPIYELGGILDQGLIKVEEVGFANTYQPSFNDSAILYTKQIYHLFGDPSMRIYTEKPNTFQSPLIQFIDSIIRVRTEESDCRITFYEPASGRILSYIGNDVSYQYDEDNVIISIDKPNYIPYIQECKRNIYIQNDIINYPLSLVGKNIYIGTNVTNQINNGDVLFNNADVSIQGESVVIEPNTTIKHSNFKVNIQIEE